MARNRVTGRRERTGSGRGGLRTGFLFFCMVLPLCSGLLSCTGEETIKVGMIASLTGRAAALGTSGRDGALLAFEQFNARGGVGGKSVELIVRDSKMSSEQSRQIVDEFVSLGVAAILGPMTSSTALTIVPMANLHKIPVISPTVSSVRLSGKKDFFFRVFPASNLAAEKTAEYAFHKRNASRVHVVYDTRNSGYTEPWLLAFAEKFKALGGNSVESTRYSSERNFDFLQLAKHLEGKDMDCLLILASGTDTALICQQLAKLGVKVAVFASEWSATADLIEYGGEAVEGLELFHSFDQNDTSPQYMRFSEEFMKRFGYSPSFGSAYSYNAANILLKQLERGGSPEFIARNIVDQSPYTGVQKEIRFDEFGDVVREYTLLRIWGKRFISVHVDAQN